MSSLTAVTHVAFLRVASSEEPERFQRLVGEVVSDVTARGLNNRATAAWTAADPVALAAEIEAMAGARRLRALHHPDRCRCEPCKVTARVRAVSKDLL
ncbi:hypothetical protein [Streptomyces sp. NBC_01233]|uniref:hypothetical protein n=1 Tax=Streptomyces sp. NBC_01233 TaxID=2903787 RepID=UPI002E140984|nr:hypothetical protein OG332_24360 [Streptomyces sp. NBC_01233]